MDDAIRDHSVIFKTSQNYIFASNRVCRDGRFFCPALTTKFAVSADLQVMLKPKSGVVITQIYQTSGIRRYK
jgi:hypothetical protein